MSTGFKNAPSVTTWAVGMRVGYDGTLYRVIDIQSDGAATLVPDRSFYAPHHIKALGQCHIARCGLNVDSIWVGRTYTANADPKQPAQVLAVCGDQIGFVSNGSHCWPRHKFLANYTPDPLPEPGRAEPPVKVGDILCVLKDKQSIYGKITEVYPTWFRIGGTFAGDYNFADVTITKLVPEDQPGRR